MGGYKNDKEKKYNIESFNGFNNYLDGFESGIFQRTTQSSGDRI